MQRRKPRILLIDDDLAYTMTCRPYLEKDFALEICNNLDEGLFRMKHEWFPIALIDKRWGDEREGEEAD